MSELDPKILKAFLRDLTRLTKKHGLAISACGCCGSPWVIADEVKNRHYTTDDNGDNLGLRAKDST